MRRSKAERGEGIRAAALRLLARREHTVRELRVKLCAKGYAEQDAEEVARALTREGLLSEERFVEDYTRSRIGRGWGPLRIKAELHERGIGDDLIDAHVNVNAAHWDDVIHSVRSRRYGGRLPRLLQERARQARFLHSRGFTAEQIRRVLAYPPDDGHEV